MNPVHQFTMSLTDAASSLHAESLGKDVMLDGVSTDTRTLHGSELFIALRGPNFDGHEFVSQAMARGAAAIMVDHELAMDIPQLIVKDTRLAMGQLARVWRERFNIPVLAVTGSNGKTTVKEMLASIMSSLGDVHATRGNLNNDIGVPLTLFKLGAQHQSAVIEMGANHPGEIAYLVGITKPDIGIITNAAAAHLEGFGSLEGVARAKGEIYAGLADSGIAIVNADDQFVGLWRDIIKPRKKIEFGLEHRCDVSAEFKPTDNGNQTLIKTTDAQFKVNLPLLGRHNVMNALAATAAALAVGVTPEIIRQGLEKMQAVAGRLQLKAGLHGSRIIDDTYNANPASVNAAIKVLQGFAGDHFMALGDMGELGRGEAELHRQVGQVAREQGVNRLYTIGELAKHAANEFGEHAYSFDAHDRMAEALHKDLHKDATLLVKGSRRMHMERVVDALTIEKGA